MTTHPMLFLSKIFLNFLIFLPKVIEVLDHIKVNHKNAVWVEGAGQDPTEICISNSNNQSSNDRRSSSSDSELEASAATAS